jgi:DNA-binding phage protein
MANNIYVIFVSWYDFKCLYGKSNKMAITRKFRDTIMDRAAHDPEFRCAMLVDGINYILTGDAEDIAVGKAFIRDYVNATIGFDDLEERTGLRKETLMRMLSTKGNPTLSNLNMITRTLLELEKLDEPCQQFAAAE